MPDRKRPSAITPHECFLIIRPLLDDVAAHVRKAPLSDAECAGLMVLVATHFFGCAMAEERRAIGRSGSDADAARAIMELISTGLKEKERPTLKVIKGVPHA